MSAGQRGCCFSFFLNLITLGYIYEGDLGLKGREVFKLLKDKNLPEHHLYVCFKGEHELLKHLAFRDYLRKNTEDAQKLIDLKRHLEETCKTREEYIEKKAFLVNEITKKSFDFNDDLEYS